MPDPSRRSLLRCLAAGLLPPAASARVVIARDDAIRQSSARMLGLVDKAVAAFYGRDSAAEAWKLVAKPGEVVGLKVNCLAGKGASTSVVLVDAVCERLRQAGIRDIVIWDRLNDDLENAGFRLTRRDGVKVMGNDTLGYESDLAVYGSAGSLMSKTLTRAVAAVINMPVLKDHGIAGVTMALKSFFGAIHNPNKYHLNVGDPYVADVYMLPPIRQKTRLAICDAISPQYEGGQSYMPQWSWPHNGLLVARDPVALDTVGWRIIEEKRAERGMKTLKAEKREPTYIATAAARGLGTNDPRRIRRLDV